MKLNIKIAFLPVLVLFTVLGTVFFGSGASAGGNRNDFRAGQFQFALIGDVPYGDENVAKFDNLIDEVNAERPTKFVLHAGDIKGGSSECSDERFQARFDQYQKFNAPFIFTPGDNEWTDCHRTNAGEYNPIERLAKLREIFYPQRGFSTGGRRERVLSQATMRGYEEYVENQLWTKRRVLFSVIHVVGSNNNLSLWNGIGEDDTDGVLATSPSECAGEPTAPVDIRSLCEQRTQEYLDRSEAAEKWLELTFARAERQRSPGVFIMIHANPRFDLPEGDPGRAGFESFLALLKEKTLDFGKPVVLAQGDFHEYILDQPWDDVPNFTRVQTDGADRVNWARVTVNPKSEDVFEIENVIVEANL